MSGKLSRVPVLKMIDELCEDTIVRVKKRKSK
jgi:hypothetical protein